MSTSYYFNGKYVGNRKKLPKNAKFLYEVKEEYYGDEAYKKKQDDNAYKYFEKAREMREDMGAYHG